MEFESADWVSSIFAEGMGRGWRATGKDGSARRGGVSDQAGHRAGPDSGSGDGEGGPRGCSGRRRLRHQHRVSRRTHETWPAICCGSAKLDDSLGAWQTAFASQATREDGTTSAVIAADHGPSTRLREAVGDEPALHGLAGNHLA